MKKTFYGDSNNQSPILATQDEYINSDNEKRKLLSIETNRRRREMALRVKKQIEKEEERRNTILQERREYHENLTNKMRKTRRIKSAKHQNNHLTSPQLKPWDLDKTLNLIRNCSSNSAINYTTDRDNLNMKSVLEGAWSDTRDVCPSPMVKYSGSNSSNRGRTSDFFLKTFETKLMAQEQLFKQKQNSEMTEFSRILDAAVDGTEKINYHQISIHDLEQSATYRVPSEPNNVKERSEIETHSNVNIEEVSDDSLDNISDEKIQVVNNNKVELQILPVQSEVSVTIQKPQQVNNTGNIQSPIKSILKKDMNSKFNSNPDLAGIMLRDSVEVARIKSARVKRCNSFSQGINQIDNKTINDDNNYNDDDGGRKYVRFADDPHVFKKANVINIAPNSMNLSHVTPDNSNNSTNVKFQKISTVPISTQLKPPLHPRSVQEGSYLQNNLKKTPIFHPPQKPRKISAEILDHEVGSILNQKKPMKNPVNVSNPPEISQQGEFMIAVDKTPTEREIDQLWAEVRECLSKTQNPSKTGSVGTPAGISVRTLDSGSESSVRSAPTWQRNNKKIPLFQVRHHGSLTPKQNIYQGQEPPIKDLVIVHAPHEPYINSGVTQQSLSVLSRQDQGFQQVSESLEEFLATENACHVSQSPRNVFLPHPPLTLNRPRFRPPIKYKYQVPITPSTIKNIPSSSDGQRTQLSMDEEKIKMSLDRLNERLKSVTNIL